MIIVTGGAGFIGSNVVARLSALGHDVVVADRLGSTDKWRNIAKHYLQTIIAPEQLPDFLATEVSAVSAVIHLGAAMSTTLRDGDEAVKNNLQLSQNLWQWCARNGKAFIYASSAATYGDGLNGSFSDDTSAAAMAALRPKNLYGWSKHAFDRFAVTQAARKQPCPPQWVGLKFFNVYGPNEYHKGDMQSVVPGFVQQLQSTGQIKLFRSYRADVADGEQRRDFVWVDDCVNVIEWLLTQRHISGVFNVGSGQARSFNELATICAKALGLPPAISYSDMPEAVRGHYQYFTQADLTKLRAAGYSAPMTPLETGVTTYVTQFLTAADRYR